MSLYAVVFAGVTPFGALTVGWVAEARGHPRLRASAARRPRVVALLTILWRSRAAQSGFEP